MYEEVFHHMNTETDLERELERRLTELETVEAADPAHAVLSARTLVTFLAVVIGIAGLAWIGAAL